MGGFGSGGFGGGPYGGAVGVASPGSFPLSLIVDVNVSIAGVGSSPPAFNQGLIIGTSAVIPTVGANARLQQFTSLASILTAGFSTSSPEYIAAQIYFSQNSANPPLYLWLGRQNLTAIAAAVPHAGVAGTAYVAGDIILVTQVGGTLGYLQVLTVGGSGNVESLGVLVGEQGSGYSVASGLATTGGTGTGLEVDITAIGETPLQAVTACRAASPLWYMCGVCGATDTDALAIAGFAQAATPPMQFAYSSSTATIAAGTADNIALQLQTLNYNRVYGQYSTTQSGNYPNNIYAFAAIMGNAMGLNTGLANSYFTMKFKNLTGVAFEPVVQTQLTNIENANFNLYLQYAGGAYLIEEQGVNSNGQFFDEVLFLDMLAAQIQYNCMNVFVALPSIPQSDAGENLFINAVTQACVTLQTIGFIATSGVWGGANILNLANKQPLPKGFMVQAPAFSTQAPDDTAARKMMPIYVALIEAGAGHFLTVGVNVQR